MGRREGMAQAQGNPVGVAGWAAQGMAQAQDESNP